MIAFENHLKQFVVGLLNLLACTLARFVDNFSRTFSEQVSNKICSSVRNILKAGVLISDLKLTNIISFVLLQWPIDMVKQWCWRAVYQLWVETEIDYFKLATQFNRSPKLQWSFTDGGSELGEQVPNLDGSSFVWIILLCTNEFGEMWTS